MPQQPKRLCRSRTERVIAGVAGGLAQYFNLDPTVVRVVFVILAFLWFSGIIIYVAMWIIVPLEGREETKPSLGKRVRETAEEMKETVKKFTEDVRKKPQK